MNMSISSVATPMKSEKQKWEDMTYDARIERLLRALRDLSSQVSSLLRNRDDLGRHRHSKDGRPVIVNPIDGGGLPSEIQAGPRNTSNPFWDIDFGDETMKEPY